MGLRHTESGSSKVESVIMIQHQNGIQANSSNCSSVPQTRIGKLIKSRLELRFRIRIGIRKIRVDYNANPD